jgi:hypothetical protein
MPPIDGRKVPERRGGERFAAEVPVLVLAGDDLILDARSWNLGERGACVHLPRTLQVGSVIRIELEVIMPVKVHLGFDFDALVIDGPQMSHFIRVDAVVRRADPHPDGGWLLGIEFDVDPSDDACDILDDYLAHLHQRTHPERY